VIRNCLYDYASGLKESADENFNFFSALTVITTVQNHLFSQLVFFTATD
jgi:hypothetical protein